MNQIVCYANQTQDLNYDAWDLSDTNKQLFHVS